MFAEISGIRTNYIKEGNGGNVLLLHGWGVDAKLYSAVIAQMSKNYTVYAPDLPGFGETAEPPEPWSVDDYVDFTVKFCEAMGITETVLFGHSFGGRIIIKLLSRENCPLDVKKAILTGSAGIKPAQSNKAKMRGRLYKLGKGFLSTGPMKKLAPDALENLRKKHGSADYLAASPLMRQTLVKVVNEDLSPLLPRVKKDVLLIWGENDDATPLSDGQKMEKEMPEAALVTLQNAGHYAFLEQQFAFLRIISSFLNIQD